MVRIQLELEPERVNEIEKLMQLTGLRTKKDYFNNALTLFKWAISERSQGRQIASVDEANGKLRDLRLPALETAAELAAVVSPGGVVTPISPVPAHYEEAAKARQR